MYEILEKSLLGVHFALFIHNGGLPKPCDHLFSMKGTRYFHPDIHGRRQVQLKAISFSAGKSSSNGVIEILRVCCVFSWICWIDVKPIM